MSNHDNESSYFDFTENQYDFERTPSHSIIKLKAEINIPEEFDSMNLINEFKELITPSLEQGNLEDQEIGKKMFENASTHVPLFVSSSNFGNAIGFSKIQPTYLINKHLTDMEDLENEEVTVLARIISKKSKVSKNIVVFDIFKDFLHLNRQLRRSMDHTDESITTEIKADSDVINLEILAIYT